MANIDSNINTIGIVGLGYVGLPLAIELAKHFRVIGFDVNQTKVDTINRGNDPNNEIVVPELSSLRLEVTSDEARLSEVDFYIIAVPTDITGAKVPDLNPLLAASTTVGRFLEAGNYVVYESTVYPGCTEEVCVPLLAQVSGLEPIVDFKYGYSPERINPGDRVRTLTKIVKIVSGCDEESLLVIAEVYGAIIEAGVYEAETVKVAEAAKVIENTQRDLNISLMNELAVLFDKLDIETSAVLRAAGTKWNFLNFQPGLVGGHCIGVDPYYLLHKARQVNIEPQVIAAGRRINDDMPGWISDRMVKTLLRHSVDLQSARVLIMGVTFKEDVSDVRNSKVIEVARALRDVQIRVDLYDPVADQSAFEHSTGLQLVDEPRGPYDGVIVAVAHASFKRMDLESILRLGTPSVIVFDLKGIYERPALLEDRYWRL